MKKLIFKLQLGALIPRSVGWLVGRSVGPPKITKKITKLYKTLQNIAKRYKTFGKTVKEALAVCRSQRETNSLQKTPQYSLFT